MALRAIITGATGMVGEGVLHQSLHHPDVESVLVIGRRPCGVKHDKLKELLVKDFFDLSSIEQQMNGFNACFFCLGVSSIGMKENDYRRITHDLTLHVAHILSGRNPDMTFCYVSGMGTDSTEKGRSMWARIKGKTENDLMALPFKASYMFRPGFIKPIPGLKNALTISKALDPLYPFMKRFFPKGMVTLEDIGSSMINVSLNGYPSRILECTEITGSADSR